MVAVILPVPYDRVKYFAEVRRIAEEILGRGILTHVFVHPWFLVAEALGATGPGLAPRGDPEGASGLGVPRLIL